jgi:acetyltransferase-like isoleucine patch superfamily enzyme
MTLVEWVRRRDSPLQRRLYAILRAATQFDVPVIPGIHHLLKMERSARRGPIRYLFHKIYSEPLFRLYAREVGKHLTLHEGMPKILGPLQCHLGDFLALSGRQTWIAAGNSATHVLTVGNHSYIGHACDLVVGSRIDIGSHVLIANRVVLNGYDGHPLDPFARAGGDPPEPRNTAIAIGDYAWLGNDVTILKGVSVGKGAVVASGSVVTKDVADLTVVGGNPAVPIRTIDPPDGWPPASV